MKITFTTLLGVVLLVGAGCSTSEKSLELNYENLSGTWQLSDIFVDGISDYHSYEDYAYDYLWFGYPSFSGRDSWIYGPEYGTITIDNDKIFLVSQNHRYHLNVEKLTHNELSFATQAGNRHVYKIYRKREGATLYHVENEAQSTDNWFRYVYFYSMAYDKKGSLMYLNEHGRLQFGEMTSAKTFTDHPDRIYLGIYLIGSGTVEQYITAYPQRLSRGFEDNFIALRDTTMVMHLSTEYTISRTGDEAIENPEFVADDLEAVRSAGISRARPFGQVLEERKVE